MREFSRTVIPSRLPDRTSDMDPMTLTSSSQTTTFPPPPPPASPASPAQVTFNHSVGTQTQPETLSRDTQTCAIDHAVASEPSSSGQAGRHPRRQGSNEVSYKEDEDEDNRLYCEDCGDVHLGDCPVHGPLHHIEDKPVPVGTPLRADLTLPEGLLLCKSSTPDALHGVYTMIALPKRTCFGPYEGVVLQDVNEGTGYTWEVRNGGQRHLVDARPLSESNWMRYVNRANSEQERNLVAYQYKGCIYYRTYKDVEPGSELLVWYGTQFAKELGIVPHSKTQAEHKEKGKDKEEEHVLFKCSQCGNVFFSMKYLRKHEKRNHCPKRHRCRFCAYRSDDRSRVRQHESIHTGDTPHVCEVCSKGFTHKSSLMRHVNTVHKGERPYECPLCGWAFKQKGNLKKHGKIHASGRPYLCKTCGKAFKEKIELSRHVFMHTGVVCL